MENPVQYTIRLLPSFLIRHSRQFTQEVLDAIEDFKRKDIFQTIFDHGWNDTRTLKKYFNRAMERCNLWRIKLQEEIIKMEGQIPIPSIGDIPDDNVLPADIIRQFFFLRHEKFGEEIITVEEGRLCFLAKMSEMRNGLGPP
jgi:hypothetical protein